MTVVSDSLLSVPMSSTVRAEVHYDRVIGRDYANLSDRFLLPASKDYAVQFYHVYRTRFSTMKPLVEKSIKSHLGESAPIKKLSDLSSETEGKSDSVVIGTIFKIQKNKPNILRELEGDLSGLAPSHQYTSEDDELILEDEEQRIKLVGDAIDKNKLVTGIILGVYGSQNNGKFNVKKVFYPQSIKIKRYIPLKNMYIAFISNIQISSDDPSNMERFQLAIDWLTGFEGCPKDQEKNASIERIIIVGGILGNKFTSGTNSKNQNEELNDGVRLFENALLQLVKSIKVDIVPGHKDNLSNASFPQQPLHKCLFPRASSYVSTLQTVTNPYFFQLEDTLIYGTSGKNIDDISRNSSLQDPLDVMECLLKWGHVCPTSPDTVGCFPYKDKDPFVMGNLPHVFYSSGEGDEFRHKVVDDSLVMSLPSFASSGVLVLLNLKDLSTQEIRFSVN